MHLEIGGSLDSKNKIWKSKAVSKQELCMTSPSSMQGSFISEVLRTAAATASPHVHHVSGRAPPLSPRTPSSSSQGELQSSVLLTFIGGQGLFEVHTI